MIKIVYWESIVWRIIANRVVYVTLQKMYVTQTNGFTLSSASTKSYYITIMHVLMPQTTDIQPWHAPLS